MTKTPVLLIGPRDTAIPESGCLRTSRDQCLVCLSDYKCVVGKGLRYKLLTPGPGGKHSSLSASVERRLIWNSTDGEL